MSGTLRSTLDVFDEYQDAEIVRRTLSPFLSADILQYEALRRVHLIPSEDVPDSPEDFVNTNVFRDLDSAVSEGGENFSTGSGDYFSFLRKPLMFTAERSSFCAWHEQS